MIERDPRQLHLFDPIVLPSGSFRAALVRFGLAITWSDRAPGAYRARAARPA